MKNLKHNCNDCKYFGTDELDDPCFSCFDDNCHWKAKDETARDCSTCKYETLRVYDAPCNTCYRRKEFGATNWEPKEAWDEIEHRENIIDTVMKIEDILRESGLSWSMSYIPSTKSYSIYLSDATDVESDE